MTRIPQARKAAILAKMLLPQPLSIRELSQKEGISEATLYHWRSQLRREGRPVPEHDKSGDNWSSQTKFAVVVETSAMSEVDLNEYCRAKGLYPEQVKQWREISVQAHDNAGATSADSNRQMPFYASRTNSLSERFFARTKHWQRRLHC